MVPWLRSVPNTSFSSLDFSGMRCEPKFESHVNFKCAAAWAKLKEKKKKEAGDSCQCSFSHSNERSKLKTCSGPRSPGHALQRHIIQKYCSVFAWSHFMKRFDLFLYIRFAFFHFEVLQYRVPNLKSVLMNRFLPFIILISIKRLQEQKEADWLMRTLNQRSPGDLLNLSTVLFWEELHWIKIYWLIRAVGDQCSYLLLPRKPASCMSIMYLKWNNEMLLMLQQLAIRWNHRWGSQSGTLWGQNPMLLWDIAPPPPLQNLD